jgi:hypothetical protein
LESLRRGVKRPAVRVRWELEEYTLSHRYAERLPFFEGQPFSTAPTEPDSLAEPRNQLYSAWRFPFRLIDASYISFCPDKVNSEKKNAFSYLRRPLRTGFSCMFLV